MSLSQSVDRLELPESLRSQLLEFRRRVWSIKMIEAACAAVFITMVSFLLMFGLDRIWDTPTWPRVGLFVAALLGCALVPLALYRWVWCNRRLEQLARLLSRSQPHVGDQLLGIIELVRSDSEQARSRKLCEAAIQQVAEDARKRDLTASVPAPRHKQWSALAAVPCLALAALSVLFPAAVTNSWARLLAPWKNTPRYTFAALEPLPSQLVVAHGEPFTITASLAKSTVWRPQQGVIWLGKQHSVAAPLVDGRYTFDLPALIDPGTVQVRIGDSVQRVRIEPTARPELTSVVARISLPDYLGRTQTIQKDIRGGALSLVKGSRASFAATATRKLLSAQIDGQTRKPEGARVSSPEVAIEGSRTLEFRWQDEFGLAGREPFTLTITGKEDEAPTLTCEQLPRQKVVLDSETLSFRVKAEDDFGLKRIGFEWQGVDTAAVTKAAKGERILAAGASDKESLDVSGTFSAQSLGIEPQPIVVRVFTEDYFPGRPRVYSPPHTLYVLNAEQHAIWLTEQLSKWHRQSLEVRDREMQLHETNKQLRALSADELDQPETRRRLETQSMAERANGRRLSNLVTNGEELVRQAMRNPEFGVGHLEKWAEMLQILKDISGNRMPSVADLLKQAAQAPMLAANAARLNSRTAGQLRDSAKGTGSTRSKEAPKQAVPAIVDQESSQQPQTKKLEPQEPRETKNSAPRLTLPVTTLAGQGGGSQPPPPPVGEKVDTAVTQQRDLLAEFDKIADELNRVLANLEGSTLVKRLKAASRLQYRVSGRISSNLADTFGLPAATIPSDPSKVLAELSTQEVKGSHDVSLIMDDMYTYFERRRFMRFKTVLDEMKQLDVIGSLRQLADDLKTENGVSISQCEYWSDSLDRWAEDLVDPANSGSCPGGKTRSSLPPSLVLEALQILEGEVNLREETRVTEQAKLALETEEYLQQASKLSETQDKLRDRVDKLTQKILELPDGESEFGYEISLLGAVSKVMREATEILAEPHTAGRAMGAETEAIELLLKSKRINPKAGGGGGGSNPGGGGGGKTQDSALALVGGGVNDKEVREDHGVSQATGDAGPSLPEEFRSGLDEYFNRLERGPSGR